LILCSSLPEGGSSSGLKTSSHTGGSGVEKRSYTHGSSCMTSSGSGRMNSSSSSSGYRQTQSPSSTLTKSPGSTFERKTYVTRHATYEGSSSANSSPEFPRKEFGMFFQSCPSEHYGRPVHLFFLPGTELDDVKRLLKGSRSASCSPTRSPSSTLPIPKKAVVETKMVTESSQSGTWQRKVSNAGAIPNNFYSGGNTKRVRMPEGCPDIRSNNVSFLLLFAVFGVPNNLAPSNPTLNTGLSTSSTGGTVLSSQGDDILRKDCKFLLLEKENVPAKKEMELLIMTKDSGKVFSASTTGLNGEDTLKKEKQGFSSSYGADAGLKSEANGKKICPCDLIIGE
uniref:Uncharacterized protein n=1 Tax=Apteryx owenii TaxID=8824 RepID=A0A8B9PGV5_APTOW